MATCSACGEKVRQVLLPEHEMDLGGVKVVLHDAVIEEVCDACGERAVVVPDLNGLIVSAAVARLLEPVRLRGREVRFVRKALGMNGRAFAKAMQIRPETLSRWEQGMQGVGGYAEQLLRHNACALLREQFPAVQYDPAAIAHMVEIGEDADLVLHLHKQQGWSAAKLAA
ncbi:MAG: hypothetical protein U1E45_15640 [Geminicoccaceae bacterium]